MACVIITNSYQYQEANNHDFLACYSVGMTVARQMRRLALSEKAFLFFFFFSFSFFFLFFLVNKEISYAKN